MKFRSHALIIVLAALIAPSGQAEPISSTVPLDGISRIHMYGSSTIHISQGGEEYVKLTMERKYLDEVEARVRGSVLSLSVKHQNTGWLFSSTPPVRFDVQVQNLSQVRLNGAGKAYITDLEVDRLALHCAGSGRIEMQNLHTGNFRLRVAGSGDLTASGFTTDEADFRIMGSGDLSIDTIETESLEIVVAGSGGVDIGHLTAGELEIRTSGSADMNIAGAVKHQRLEINGSGRYRAANLESQVADIEVNGSGKLEIAVRDRLTSYLSRGAEVTYRGGPDLVIDSGGRGRLLETD